MTAIARRVASFGTTIFAEINDLANRYDAVNLGQGKPDFDGPPEVLEAAAQALLDGRANQYAPGPGIYALREGIARHAREFYELDINPETGVVVTSGASEGLLASILGLLDPGDEIIVIEPYFDLYIAQILMADITPVYVPLHPPSWSFHPDEMRAAFNHNTRAILINTPHNPTGRVFTCEELNLIAELCKEYNAIAISDEVYEHLLYNGNRHIPIATLPGMFERSVTVSSAAKTFSVTGWKVGWAYGHPDLIQGVWRAHQFITFAVNHPGQYGVAHGLQMGKDYYKEYRGNYSRKREIMLQGLEAAGLKANSPEGTFYVMADFSDVFAGSDEEFARHLITEIGVAAIPPSSFFCDAHRHIGSRHIRFSFCKNDATLYEGAQRLARLRT